MCGRREEGGKTVNREGMNSRGRASVPGGEVEGGDNANGDLQRGYHMFLDGVGLLLGG